MILYSGLGFLAGVILVACLVITQLILGVLFDDDGYYTAHTWPKVLALAIAAPIIWLAGRRMNGHPLSPYRGACGARHTLFFIPMEYWGPIFLAIGTVMVLGAALDDLM
jgi:hypothetical protein